MSEFDTSSPPPPDNHPRRSPFARLAGLFGGQVGRGAMGAIILRSTSILLGLLTGVLLARALGVSGFGAYSFALSWFALLSIPATLGFDQLLVREVAKLHVQSDWAHLRGILRRSNEIALTTCAGLVLLTVISIQIVDLSMSAEMTSALYVALVILPIGVVLRLRQSTMRALGRIFWAQLPDTVLAPITFIALIGLAYMVYPAILNGTTAMVLYAVAVSLALAVGLFLFHLTIPLEINNVMPEFQSRVWITSAIPFVIVFGFSGINGQADMIILGIVGGAEATGMYRAASYIANLVAFPLHCMNIALAPEIARLYSVNDMAKLQWQVTKAARGVLVLASPIAIVAILFGKQLLGLFGTGFESAYAALVILTVGQLVNVAMGSVGYLLMMTKHEQAAAVGLGASAVVGLSLYVLLIPTWGMTGAAVATASSLILTNVLLAVAVYYKLGIYTTSLGRPRARKAP